MATLRERLEEARQIIEGAEQGGFQSINPDRFFAEFERANRIYAEKILADLQEKGCFNEQIKRVVLSDKNQYFSNFERKLESDGASRRTNSLVGENYNRTYNILKTFMDKFSLEDQADEQEKERAAKYDNKERQRAMGYRLLTTFLVGIVFMVLAYGADMAGFQFVFLHKKPDCPENYVCIKQEDHDKQQKEIEELTNRVATYAVPASKLVNPIPSELKPQPDVIQSTKSTPKQKE